MSKSSCSRFCLDKTYDVCIITTIHRDFDNRIYHRQLNALADVGLSILIVAPWDFTKRDRDDYDYIALDYPSSRMRRIAHAVKTFLAMRKVRAQVYIFHDNDFLPLAWLHSIMGARKVIYDAHENIPEEILYGKEWIPVVIRRPLSAAFRWLENAVVRRLGLAIAAVPHLRDRFAQLGAQVALVHNYPNFVAPKTAERQSAVLYTGELVPDYGVWTIIEIARQFKTRGTAIPIRVVDRFHDDEELRGLFRAIVEREELSIEILPSVPVSAMPELLTRGSIGLIPNHDVPNKALALPTKGFEYFLFGVIAVASNVRCNRAIIEDGVTGFLVDPLDAAAWANTIERIWNDEELQERVRRAARHAVETRFHWEGERRV